MISIVIPTYNERENIRVLLPAIQKVLRRLRDFQHEIVLVDDDSPDGTASLVRSFARRQKRIKVFVRKGKRGLGEAILFGITQSSGDIIVGMDGDGNHDPEVLPKMIRAMKTADLVIGSRFMQGGGMTDPFRYAVSFVFNGILRLLFRFPIWDNTSGYYAIQRATLRSLHLKKIFYGYGDYHLRLVYIAAQRGLRIQEIPAMYKRRLYGQSKSRLLIMLFTYLKTAYLLTRARIYRRL